ncbi:HIT family protein [Aureimonas sp. AU12]|jgi:diadenosine tetraphosphate (Ap4A) HIT family hydrolase|uniref:HIT family protein n=1 Tax=Aureimonas sp. AU12 TaxID=1638161 RepID=UPI000784CF6D|nr:HIT family protein [Aureimonas sp. AU12]
MQAASTTPPSDDLDPRLLADTRPVADLSLCRVLLMNDSRWPWLILVPRRTGVVELFDMASEDRAALTEEASRCAEALKAATSCEKINVATLGNSVRQFHLHVVARSTDDPNWPRPVWGFETATPYDDDNADEFVRALRESL